MIFKHLLYHQSCLHDLNLFEIRINIIRFYPLNLYNPRSILYKNQDIIF